jgi:hypothetical protein
LPPDALLGPLALLVGALLSVAVLWREHLRADADDRAQRDKAIGLLEASLDANQRMAHAWEERNRRDAAARRRSDS